MEIFSKYEKATLVSVKEISNEGNWIELGSANPSNGLVTLNSPDSEKFNVTVYDLNGKLISSSTNNINTTNVDLTNFESGLYLIYIENDQNRSVIKLVKE